MSEAPALDRRALARWRAAIVIGFALGGITISAWGPRLPALTAELHVSTGTIGVLLAFTTLGSIGGLLLATPVMHRLGSRRGISGALLVIAVALAALGLAVSLRSLPFVSLTFVVVGLALGALDVMLNVEGSAIERSGRRTLMPLLHAAWSVGAAAGSGIGAGCAALGVTPGEQFAGEAVLLLVVGLSFAVWIPPGSRAGERTSHRSGAERFRQWLQGWGDWRLLLIGVVMFGAELGEGSANSWLTLGVKEDHGQSAAVAALFFTVFACGEALARILGGPVVDRVGRVGAIRITTALGVAGVALFILGPTPWLVLPGVLLWAVGVSMGFPLGMSSAAESGPNPAARVSVVASIGYFASLAGPPIVGGLAEGLGLLNALWLIAALFVAAFLCAGALGVRREDGARSAPKP